MLGAQRNEGSGMARIVIEGGGLWVEEAGRRRALSPFWLRERSREPDQLDAYNQQRLYNNAELPLDLSLRTVEELPEGRLVLTFSDGHRARYERDWLAAEASMSPGQDGLPPRRAWLGDLSPLPKVAWADCAGEAGLSAACEAFLALGFVVLTGVPGKEGAVLELGRRFGYVRDTNFGPVFDVRNEPKAIDLAYTGLALAPHVDNPYRAPQPGIQILHCLVNDTSGGDSLLVDGLALAEELRVQEPGAFRLLTQTPVRFRWYGEQHEHVSWVPLLQLDLAGRLEAVHISPRLDYVPLMEPEAQAAYYRARAVLQSRLSDLRFHLTFRLGAGEAVMFDNRRLLHGRTAFDTREGPRHLQGCYIDLEGPRSLWRVLNRNPVAARAAAE
jgi:gamma-butyrobetaine dioxygenase